MATRSQIAFYDSDNRKLSDWQALIYRHWDGYPDGVLPDLLPVLAEFHEHRGLADWEYAAAWLVRSWKEDYLNIGVSNSFHADIEFLYAVYPSGRVAVYSADCWDGEPKFQLLLTQRVDELTSIVAAF